MLNLPRRVQDYLLSQTLGERSFAYLQTTAAGHLLDWSSSLVYFQIPQPHKQQSITEVMTCLEGWFPLEQPEESLPGLQLDADIIVDIHLIAHDETVWILLVDASGPLEQHRQLQQKGNELSLLRRKYNQLIQQSPDNPSDQLDIRGAGEQRLVSVLLIQLHDLTNATKKTPPADIMSMLGTLLTLMTHTVVEEGGLVQHVFGDMVIFLFGVLPSQMSSAEQAVAAAQRILQRQGASEQMADPQVGLGGVIATGLTTLGLLKLPQQSLLAMVNPQVDWLLQLRHHVQASELMLDTKTFESLSHHRADFQSVTVQLGGDRDSLQVYSQTLS